MITIAVNAGHWKHNPKGVPRYMPKLGGTLEFDLNCRVTDEIVRLLSDYEVNVVQNFDRAGEMKEGNELTDRIAIAEKAKANFYLSIHHNGGINGGLGGGTTVYCYNTTKNRRQATEIYDNIRKHTGLVGNRATPVNYKHKQHQLIEVIQPTMDAVLVECAFMDSKTDIEYIAKKEWATQVATGIVEFFVKEYSLKLKTGQNGAQNAPNKPSESVTYIPTYYTVVKGDILSKIATKYKTTVDEILSLNPSITNPNKISIGQKILVNVSSSVEQPVELKVGDVVKLKDGATYYNGKAIPNWVKNSKLYYRGDNKNGAIISILKIGAITGTTAKSNLIKA